LLPDYGTRPIDEVFVVIRAVGIGPGVPQDGKYITESGISVNGHRFDFCDYWPYWGEPQAEFFEATFYVPIDPQYLNQGQNNVFLTAGQIKSQDFLDIDNYIIKEINIIGLPPST